MKSLVALIIECSETIWLKGFFYAWFQRTANRVIYLVNLVWILLLISFLLKRFGSTQRTFHGTFNNFVDIAQLKPGNWKLLVFQRRKKALHRKFRLLSVRQTSSFFWSWLKTMATIIHSNLFGTSTHLLLLPGLQCNGSHYGSFAEQFCSCKNTLCGCFHGFI